MNNKKKDKFVYIWSSVLIVLIFISVFSIGISLRGTHAYFGDGTTGTFTIYTVYYNSKYPSDLLLKDESRTDKQESNDNVLLENMFLVPDGYLFDGWYDEEGIKYMPGEVKSLKNDILLCAGWKKIDEEIISYGDANLNGVIDEEDYKLVSEHINGSSILVDDALINADANNDKKVDLIDVDIIKNAFLGTNGYVGYLPNMPILIYDVYEGNMDASNGEVGEDNQLGGDGEGNSSSNESSNGNGNSGTGTGSVSGGDNKTPSGTTGGSGNTSSNGSSSNNQVSEDSSLDKEEDNEEIKVTEKKDI